MSLKWLIDQTLDRMAAIRRPFRRSISVPAQEEPQVSQEAVTSALVNRLVLEGPTPQTALDIFRGNWLSQMPAPFAKLQAGDMDLFEDGRIRDAEQHLGDMAGKTVLDIGPLEGGHPYILERLGAKSIVAVEANPLMYLKCLVTKEILGLQRVRYLCGEINAYLTSTSEHFDVCVASGVLYHMSDPVRLLWLIAGRADKVVLWTHYVDEDDPARNVFGFEKSVSVFQGEPYNYYRQDYGDAQQSVSYSGGVRGHSHWMAKAGIMRALECFGFDNVVLMQDVASDHGAYLLLAASKLKKSEVPRVPAQNHQEP